MSSEVSESDSDMHMRLDNELQELGVKKLIGDTLESKQNLLQALRLSTSTTKEDEEKTIPHLSSQDKAETTDDDCTQLEGDIFYTPNSKTVCGGITSHQKQFLASRGSDIFKVGDKSQNESSSPDLILLDVISSPSSKQISTNVNDITYTNCEEETDTQLTVSPLKPKPKGPQKKLEDRIRNIDVWNCVKDPNENTLGTIVPAIKRDISVPFYFPPAGMSDDDYIQYFKKHVNVLLNAHYKQQRQSLTFVPWGKPILPETGLRPDNRNMYNFDFMDEEGENGQSASQNERYNLRRANTASGALKRNNPSFAFQEDDPIASSDNDDIISTKRKKNDTLNEKPTSEIEGDETVEELFTKRPGRYEQGLGNLSAFEDHKDISWAEKRRPQRNVNKSVKQNECLPLSEDSDEDFQPSGRETVVPKLKLSLPPMSTTVKRRRGPNKQSYKRKNKSIKTEEPENKNSESLWMNTNNPPVEIKPKPIFGLSKTTQKRLSNSNSLIGQNKGNKLDPQNEPKLSEEQIVEELNAVEVASEAEEFAECPMCSKEFPANQIENHANMCCDNDSQSQENVETDFLDSRGIGNECPLCHAIVPEIYFEKHSSECVIRGEKSRRIIPGARGGNTYRIPKKIPE